MATIFNTNQNNTSPSSNYSVAGSNGYIGGVTNSATISWAPPQQNFVSNNGQPIMTIPHGEQTVVLEEKATLDVKGRVRINGEFLDERLERIETLLQIPTRDVTMEAKYSRLKEIWAEYNRELAKLKTWDALKGNSND